MITIIPPALHAPFVWCLLLAVCLQQLHQLRTHFPNLLEKGGQVPARPGPAQARQSVRSPNSQAGTFASHLPLQQVHHSSEKPRAFTETGSAAKPHVQQIGIFQWKNVTEIKVKTFYGRELAQIAGINHQNPTLS